MVALRTEEEQQRVDNRRQRTSRTQPIKRQKRRVVERDNIFSIFRPEGMADEPLSFVRKDALVDSMEYRDTGCELARSCLACPLPRCQYDAPRSAQMWLTAARDREIAVLRGRHRVPVDALARTYGLTRRTIYRILQEQRALRHTSNN